MSLSLLLYPTPVGAGMYSSLKTPVQDPILHVLSRITFSFAESRLFQGHLSPQTCQQLNMYGTPSGDMSGDGSTKPQDINELADALPVSYTHLTLPTKLSV